VRSFALISASGTASPAERRTVAMRLPGCTAARTSLTCGANRSTARSISSTASASPQKCAGRSLPPARAITSSGSCTTSSTTSPSRKKA
jgi:hypothetical protein